MDSFSDLSSPVKITVVGVPITVAAADAAFIAHGLPWPYVLLFSFLGLVIAALILWGVYRWIQKRRGGAFEGDIDETTRRSSSAGAPSERAAMEDLRRRFLEGFERYKRDGFNPYEVPWYLVMGEPGSGKTFAVKHSGIGFLSGMQDEQQGTGGTKTMDWWFTKSGVLLDTAGRWSTGSTGGQTLASQELGKFLQLLRKHRAKCPINGLILVLDGQRMQRETPEETREKAKQLSEALVQVKRELDVRFPVIVWISKCDTIPGFRSYFRSFSDLKQQEQMLGWSNPAENIDAPFQPEQVEDYLSGIAQDLRRRRWQQMYEVTLPGDSRRMDAVDSLFVFPTHLEKLTPSIRLYLEIIFGDMRRAPFLRGIYFNSAVTEGAEADSKIAGAMGLSLDEYVKRSRGNSSFRQDRSFFIRDTLAEKLFKEKNLVTRATNAVASFRRTQILFVAALVVCLLGMASVAWILSGQLKRTLDDPAEAWAAATKLKPENFFTSTAPFGFGGRNADIEGIHRKMQPFEALSLTLTDCTADHRIPPPFRWFISEKSDDTSKLNREKAWKRIFTNEYMGSLVAFLEKSPDLPAAREARLVGLVQFDSAFSRNPADGFSLSPDAFPATLFAAFLESGAPKDITDNAALLYRAATNRLIPSEWYASQNKGLQERAQTLFTNLLETKSEELSQTGQFIGKARAQMSSETRFTANEDRFVQEVERMERAPQLTVAGLQEIQKRFFDWRESKPTPEQRSIKDLPGAGAKIVEDFNLNFGKSFSRMQEVLKTEKASPLSAQFLQRLALLQTNQIDKINGAWKALTAEFNLAEITRDSRRSEDMLPVVANALLLFGGNFGPEPGKPLAGWNQFRAATNALQLRFTNKWEDADVIPLVRIAHAYQYNRASDKASGLASDHLKALSKWPLVDSVEFINPDDFATLVGTVRTALSDTNVLDPHALTPEWERLKELVATADQLGNTTRLRIRVNVPPGKDKAFRTFKIPQDGADPESTISDAPGESTVRVVPRSPFKYSVRYTGPDRWVDGSVSKGWGLLSREYKLWNVKERKLGTNEVVRLPLDGGGSLEVNLGASKAE